MRATRDSTLPDGRRSKADLQREVAELRRMLDEALHERDEALAQQTATAECSASSIRPRATLGLCLRRSSKRRCCFAEPRSAQWT